LFVGRFAHKKGIPYLLEAVARLRRTIPTVELHLIGDGEKRTVIHQKIHELQLTPAVVWHGWLDKADLSLYYSAANVTVLPSFSEGFPRTMLEAMACASPFLGTPISGVTDCVIDGETGLLVPPGDVSALTEHLLLLLTDTDRARQLGTAGLKHVQQHFSWSAIIARMRSDVYMRFARTPEED
jgi:glycosyltransferase involved in cell wall biosynthesis